MELEKELANNSTNDPKKTQKIKKRNRKKSKETEMESANSIKNFFKYEDKKDTNVSTPVGAKKRSPPSATKPQAKTAKLQCQHDGQPAKGK